MAQAVRLSDAFIEEAKEVAKESHRSLPKQIEYWAKLGRKNDRLAIIAQACKENPDLPYDFVEDLIDIKLNKEEPMLWHGDELDAN